MFHVKLRFNKLTKSCILFLLVILCCYRLLLLCIGWELRHIGTVLVHKYFKSLVLVRLKLFCCCCYVDILGDCFSRRQSDSKRELFLFLLRFSIDEGRTWNIHNFTSTSVFVDGLLSEPGDETLVMT